MSDRAKPYWIKLYHLSRQYVPQEYENAVWTRFLLSKLEDMDSRYTKSMVAILTRGVVPLDDCLRETRDSDEVRLSR